MGKLGWSLIVGATAFLAGCGGTGSGASGSTGTANSNQPTNLAVTTTSLPGGTVGTAYSSAVAASGGSTPYAYSAGNLPSGLSINSGTGAITGTPAQNSAGTWSATVKVTDSTQPSSQSATASLSIKISATPPTPLAVTTSSLPGGTAGSPYPSTGLQASGGVSPYAWALGSGSTMPAGLNLTTGGAISGTPSVAGSYPLTFVVTDSSPTPQTAKAALTLTISASPIPTLTLTTTTLADATLNTAYSATLTASGGVPPYAFSLAGGTSLPAGLTLSSPGAITGTPTKPGSTIFSVDVTDSSTPALSQTGSLSLTVNASAGPSCGSMSTGNGASLNGYVPFPSSNLWNTNIASAPVDPNSAAIIGALTGSHLHPDFSNVVDGNYGIPYVVVDSSATPGVAITMTTYQSESDITLYPVPITAPIEGFPADCTITGDDHLIVIDKNKCWIYETWQTERCKGAWSAANGAIWDLTSTEHRPYGWTSADAAGLPIFPGLVRYDEVAAGAIHHAFRMTVAQTKSDANGGYFVAPATHGAGNNSGTGNIMGMRLRLKAGFDISGFSAANQAILTAMQNYGMIVADNGSNMYFQGAPDARWDDNDLNALKAIDASNFDVVQMGTQYDASTAPTGAAPTISSFTASQTTVTAGTPVILNWTVSNDSYDYIDAVGPVRGGTQTVTPGATTIYTLYSTNQYGRATKSVTVNVQ
jgi:Putative Ig domain